MGGGSSKGARPGGASSAVASGPSNSGPVPEPRKPALPSALPPPTCAPASYGHSVCLVGSPDWAGEWDLTKAWRLHYRHADGGGWHTRIPLELVHTNKDGSGSPVEFKFVLVDGPGDVWETGPNRALGAEVVAAIEKAGTGGQCIVLKLVWEQNDSVVLTSVKPESKGKTAVVVLGKRLLPNGQATADLIARVKKGAAVHRLEQAELKQRRKQASQGHDKAKEVAGDDEGEEQSHRDGGVLVIVTGGATSAQEDTEAAVMKRLLVEGGVPADLVVEEPMAMTTVENVVYVYEIVEALGIDRLVVVTAAYHLDRSRALFLYMRELGPPYRMRTLTFEGSAPARTPVELAREHDVESGALRNLGAHLAGYVPGLSSFTPLPPRT